jgi:hypothetical protein
MNNLKDIVPIQQEKDLKELGFNFENEHCYLKQKLGLFQVEEPYNSFDLILFSQAFRFFREKHKLNHCIQYSGKDYVAYTHDVNGMTKYSFDTYEEAELACLDKLIELVKTK